MSGWIKLHRCLMEKAIWQCSTENQKVILITLLMMANHEDKEWEWKNERFTCKAGQFITSLESIANKCGGSVTVRNVRTALVKFEKYGFLTNQSTKTGRLITIENWGKYQGNDISTDKGADNQLTNDRQTADKQLTTNKNNKNYKNYKNDKNNIFIPPTVEEVKAYCSERKNTVDAEKFVDFYASKGWLVGKSKMKDWKASVRTWERNSPKEEKKESYFKDDPLDFFGG